MANSQNKSVTKMQLSVDSSVRNHPGFVYAKQLDVNSRFIDVTLVNSEGAIPVSGVARLNGVRPDNNKVFVLGAIDEDGFVISFALTPDFLEITGNVVCDVSIASATDSEQAVLTSSSFNLIVSESQYSKDAWEGEAEINPLAGVVAAVAEHAATAQRAANEAKEYSEDASKSAAQANEDTQQAGAYLNEIEKARVDVSSTASQVEADRVETAAMKKDAQTAASAAKSYAESAQAAAEEMDIDADDFSLEQDVSTGYVYPVFQGTKSKHGIPLAESFEVATLDEVRAYLNN